MASEQAPTIAEEQALIAEDFELFDDWRERIEYVLELGKALPRLPDGDYAEANKVKGCQSQVWMVAALQAVVLVIRFQLGQPQITLLPSLMSGAETSGLP